MKLRISADQRCNSVPGIAQRFIVQENGAPFFYLGDTAWELFHRLDRDEAAHYLRTRAAQRFTVIQAVVLAEFDGLRVPNAYGHVPFQGLDPAQPNEEYFKHVDWIVDRAAAEGLVIGMLPTWGDKVNLGWDGAAGPQVFTPENARGYGRFIGRRYRDRPLIWILGGDRRLETARHLLTYRALAEGIRDAGAEQLMTFHPAGGTSSSYVVQGEAWLDFNLLQSGHCGRDNPNWNMVDLDRAKAPPKPVLDGEPNYDDHPVMSSTWTPTGEWFDAYDVRKQAYRALLAGACGHTYGCHDVWQMLSPQHPAVNCGRTPWREALLLPGAAQMQHVRALFEARPWMKLVPDQALILSDVGAGSRHIRAARASDNTYAYMYLPCGGEVKVDIERLRGPMKASWYDPRTGAYQAAGEPAGTPILHAPTHEDWILVLAR